MNNQPEEVAQEIIQDFCDYLEYSISAALSASADADKKRCWCDGIMPPEVGQAYVIRESSDTARNRHLSITTRAWIDEGSVKGKVQGQKIYTLEIILGKKFLQNYRSGKNLKECIPTASSDDWISLNFQHHIMRVETH